MRPRGVETLPEYTRRCTGETLQRAWLADGGLQATGVVCDPAGNPSAGRDAIGLSDCWRQLAGQIECVRLPCCRCPCRWNKNILISKRRIGLRGASRRYTHACTRAAISAQLMLLDLLGGWTPCCDETCCCDGSEPCWCCGLHAEPPARSAVPAIPSAPEKKELFPPLPYLYARCTNPPQNSSVVSTSC